MLRPQRNVHEPLKVLASMKEKLWPIVAVLLPAVARILVAALVTVLVQRGLLDAAALAPCRDVLLRVPFGL